MGADDFDRIFRVNVRGLYLVTKFCLPLLRVAHGCIVNIGLLLFLVLRARIAIAPRS